MPMKTLVERTRMKDKPSRGKILKWSVWNDVIPMDCDKEVFFNTLSQNAVLLDSSVSGSGIDALPESILNELYQLGVVVDVERDEYAEQQERFRRGKEDLSYIDLTILVTHNCQMRCSYCFEGSKDNMVINDNTSAAILRLLGKHVGVCRMLRVTWFGGEPLLAYGQITKLSHQMIQFCKEHDIGYLADITTNGFALTPDRCKELVNELGVKRFIITLDGPAEVHDKRRPLASGLPSFRRIWKNIGDLVDCGAWVTLRMTIDRENRPFVPQFLKLLADSRLKGKVGLSFCRTIEINNTPKDVKAFFYSDEDWAIEEWELIQIAHNMGLWSYQFPHASPAGGCLRRGDITIAATGVIYKCLDTVGDERWICGNINYTENIHIPQWYQQWLDWTPLQVAKCSKCLLLPLCNGGCPHNDLYSDKKHGTHLQCPDWKANYRKQIFEIAKAYDQKKI